MENKSAHTEDCIDANDDTSALKGKCICPQAHTPGPWRDVGILVCTAHGNIENSIIAKVKITDNAEANARLIAAAPELLEALKIAHQCMESAGMWARGGSDRELYAKVQATIVKAEGK